MFHIRKLAFTLCVSQILLIDTMEQPGLLSPLTDSADAKFATLFGAHGLGHFLVLQAGLLDAVLA